MKNFFGKLLMILILIFMLVPSSIANAATFPIKDAWVLNFDCIIVLRTNGDLLFAHSIDSQKYDVIEHNVLDFYGKIENGILKGVILHSNGDVSTIYNDDYNNKTSCNIEIVAKNAKAIYSLPDFQYAYVDNNHVLKGKHRFVDTTEVAIMTNVNRCYNNTNYVITNDDKLCSFDVKTATVTEILTNVKDVKNNVVFKNNAVLRNNGDLYLIKGKNLPERIGQNVNDIDDVVTDAVYGTGYDSIYYLDKNNNLYKDAKLLKKDILKIFYTMEGYGELCYITKEHKLYNLGLWENEYFQEDDAEAILGETRYFFKGTDGHLYKKQGYREGYSALYIKNIDKVIKFDTSGEERDRYLFINNNGELYAAFGDSLKTPFLTSFCQKPTRVLINNKNVELTAKIQMIDNRSMYPFRECLENMGATVLWDNTNQIAIGEYNGKTIEFPIGKSEYWINGVKYTMDVPSYIDNSIGRTYIPIRYAAEGLGFTVEWIEKETENIISINE